DALKRHETSDEETAGGEENDGQSELQHDQAFSGATGSTAGDESRSTMPEAAFDSNLRGPKCRGKGEKQGRQHAYAQREKKHATIDCHFIESRDVVRKQGNEGLHATEGESEPDHARSESLHQSFNEHLTHDASAARAKCRSDIHLLSAG